MKGKKDDQDKPIAGTIMLDFSYALRAVIEVGTFGSKKYDKSNWLKVENGVERYTDAMIRHFIIEPEQYFDQESDICHAAHVAWNALARLELILRNTNNSVIKSKEAPVFASSEQLSFEFIDESNSKRSNS